MSMSNHNVNSVKKDEMSWWFQGIGNSTVSVHLQDKLQCRFVLLASLSKVRKLIKNLNIKKFSFVKQFIRLTPVYVIVLGLVATLILYVCTGPNWFIAVSSSNYCQVSWWKHFLYSLFVC